MLEVIDFIFNDQESDWQPDDPLDFDEVVTVTIGEDGTGSNYQIHLCTPSSIGGIADKRITFMLQSWQGVDSTIESINKFISEKLEINIKDEQYHHLSKYWLWEYGAYNS